MSKPAMIDLDEAAAMFAPVTRRIPIVEDVGTHWAVRTKTPDGRFGRFPDTEAEADWLAYALTHWEELVQELRERRAND